jgi:membrane glycosyltransferase
VKVARSMTLFACFPVCMTLAAIGLVGVLVVVTGTANHVARDDDSRDAAPGVGSGRPRWWVGVLIAIAVALVYVVMWWLADDGPPT